MQQAEETMVAKRFSRPGHQHVAPVLLPRVSSFRGDSFLSPWLDQNPDAMTILDATGMIKYVNPAFEVLSGYGRNEALGQNFSIIDSKTNIAKLIRDFRHVDPSPYRAVVVSRRKNGEQFHAESLIWPVLDNRGKLTNCACHMRDATDRLQLIDNLSHAATHDPLTDLPNRSLFIDRLTVAMRHAARRRESLAVAIMDIDQFKAANTRYGHLAGDAVLQAVARRSIGCLREADTVARIGGDEFALILPVANKRAGLDVLEKVRAGNALPVRYEDARIPTSVTIGASIYPQDGNNVTALWKNADLAMYAAKHAGRNCFRFHDDI